MKKSRDTYRLGTDWYKLLMWSSPASITKTEWPARARLAASGPPPGPDPMMTYSYSLLCANALENSRAKFKRSGIMIPEAQRVFIDAGWEDYDDMK